MTAKIPQSVQNFESKEVLADFSAFKHQPALSTAEARVSPLLAYFDHVLNVEHVHWLKSGTKISYSREWALVFSWSMQQLGEFRLRILRSLKRLSPFLWAWNLHLSKKDNLSYSFFRLKDNIFVELPYWKDTWNKDQIDQLQILLISGNGFPWLPSGFVMRLQLTRRNFHVCFSKENTTFHSICLLCKLL